MPGWNGPKSPYTRAHKKWWRSAHAGLTQWGCAIEGPNVKTTRVATTYADKVEHPSVLLEVEVREDRDELLLCQELGLTRSQRLPACATPGGRHCVCFSSFSTCVASNEPITCIGVKWAYTSLTAVLKLYIRRILYYMVV